MYVEMKNIYKKYGDFLASDNVSFGVEKGKLVALLGPSGSGKTTLLRMIAGLENPNEGDIFIDGKRVNDIPASKRGIGFVFQSYALFRYMTVEKNIAFGLEIQKKSKKEIKERVDELLELTSMKDLGKRYPHQLSGGQRQRVAIARTPAPEPQVLFMDEPLSNLDAKLRLEMRYELQRLHVETGSTFVYVTHDQMEAMTLATKICLINNGVLQQYEAPLTVYSRPNNLFVADFVGNPSINFIEAKGVQNENGSLDVTILDGRKAKFVPKEHLDLQRWFAERDKNEADEAARHKEKMQDKKAVEKSNKDEVFKYHIARVNEDDYALQEAPVITNEDFVIGVRPEALQLHDGAGLDGVIYGAMPTGMESTIKLRIGDFLLTGVVFGNTAYKIGQEVKFEIGGEDILLFDRKSGKLITAGRLQV